MQNSQIVQQRTIITGLSAVVVLALLAMPLFLHIGRGEILDRYPGGAKKLVGMMMAGKYAGNIREYYADGSLRSQVKYLHGEKQGVQTVYYLPAQGLSGLKMFIKVKVFNRDVHGAIFQQMFYKNDLLDGVYKEYSPQGELQRETMYLHGKKHGKDIVYSGRQKIHECVYVQGVLHGQVFNYYASGTKADSLIYLFGKQNGLQQYYYPSGQLQCQKNFVNGQQEGLTRYFYINGDLRLEQTYVRGLHTGVDREYLPGNILFAETPYVRGQIEGIKKTYNAEKQLVAEERYSKGLQEGTSTYYYVPEGSIKEKVDFHLGKKHGQVEQYYRNGSLKLESTFVAGKLEGMLRTYYEKENPTSSPCKAFWKMLFGWLMPARSENAGNKGPLQHEMPYVHDQLHGVAHVYYRSGLVHWVQTYVNGQLDGSSRVYYESGTIMGITPFKNGKEHGTAQAYYPSGKLMAEREYVVGKEVSNKSYPNR